MSISTVDDTSPRPPRRVFLAALMGAALAGGAVYLGASGLATAPMTDSFRFARGDSFATGEEARLRAALLPAVRDDRVRVIFVGHSGTTGDLTANQDLSDARAELARRIALDTGIAADRIESFGVGPASPLPQAQGLSDRAWQAELARVELTLQVRR